jgi:hypothetical protein
VWNVAAFYSLQDENAVMKFLTSAGPAVDSLSLPQFEYDYLNGLGKGAGSLPGLAQLLSESV